MKDVKDLDRQLDKQLNFTKKSMRESKSICLKEYKKILTKIERISERKQFDLKVYIHDGIDADNVADRYRIIKKIDESTFSDIFLLKELKTDKEFCLKRIKNNKDFMNQSLMEIFILNYLSKSTNPFKQTVLEIKDFFYLNVS